MARPDSTSIRAHVWFENAFGETDIFRLNAGFHNGPECIRCGLKFCHHCDPFLYDRPCPAPGGE
jgi:hypothetical protein